MFPLQFQVGFYLAAERARFAQERQMEVGLAAVLYYALKQSNIQNLSVSAGLFGRIFLFQMFYLSLAFWEEYLL